MQWISSFYATITNAKLTQLSAQHHKTQHIWRNIYILFGLMEIKGSRKLQKERSLFPLFGSREGNETVMTRRDKKPILAHVIVSTQNEWK